MASSADARQVELSNKAFSSAWLCHQAGGLNIRTFMSPRLASFSIFGRSYLAMSICRYSPKFYNSLVKAAKQPSSRSSRSSFSCWSMFHGFTSPSCSMSRITSMLSAQPPTAKKARQVDACHRIDCGSGRSSPTKCDSLAREVGRCSRPWIAPTRMPWKSGRNSKVSARPRLF